jgi:toxin ParE1/3/4
MPNKYTLSKLSKKDIDGILNYTFDNHGHDQARKYATELNSCFQLLTDNPEIGRKCDDVGAGLQRHEYGNHIMFYRLREHDIFIIRVLHECVDVKRHIKN